MDNPSAIAQRLRAIREQSGLTTRQLAAKLGVHHTFVSRIENGDRKPSADYLQNVAKFFNLNASELLQHIGIEPSSVLPPARDYLRQIGLDDRTADIIADLIEYEASKPREVSREDPDQERYA